MPPTPPGQAFQYTLNVNGRLDDTDQFEDIIVKTGNSGDVTRVRDVGRVELGAQTYSQIFSLNNKPAAGIGVFQSPGANALEVEQAVAEEDGGAGEGISRRTSNTTRRSTPPSSSRNRSRRSTRR